MVISDKKRAYGSKLVDYVQEYKSAFIVGCDNVGSKQMQNIRVSLRGTAKVLMGKNVSSLPLFWHNLDQPMDMCFGSRPLADSVIPRQFH